MMCNEEPVEMGVSDKIPESRCDKRTRETSKASFGHDLTDDSISRTDDIRITENVDFKGLLLPDNILLGLTAARFLRPSPIQLQAIPLVRLGLDLIVQAKAGTGKTLVIAIAAMEAVNVNEKRVQVVIIAPTREIAIQIKDVLQCVSSGISGLRTEAFVGGLSKSDDIRRLVGSHVAVGTPGRLQDLAENGHLLLDRARLFILDEADKLMEPELFKPVKYICKKMHSSKQTILCSATFQNPLREYVTNHMKDPLWVSPDETVSLTEGKREKKNPVSSVLLGVKQYLQEVPPHSNISRVLKCKLEYVLRILSGFTFSQCLIFSNYQSRAETLCNQLVSNGWPAISIKGKDEQSHRMSAISALKEFRCRVLLTTDVTARGIDIQGVNLVINLDIPYDSATYLHRVGRAGRFGSHGCVVTLATSGKEVESFKTIGMEIPGLVVYSLPTDLTALSEVNTSADQVYFDSASTSASNAYGISSFCADGPSNVTDTGTADIVQIEPLMNHSFSKEKEELILREAEESLVASLCDVAGLNTEPVTSYEDLSSLFESWTLRSDSENVSVSCLKGIKPCEWSVSAKMILAAAERQIHILKNEASPEKKMDTSRKPMERQNLKQKTNKVTRSVKKQNSKQKTLRAPGTEQFSRKYKEIAEEFSESLWHWDENLHIYYCRDSFDDSCYYYYNPMTKCYYKWEQESDSYYKWSSIHSCYLLWSADSKCYLKWDSNSRCYQKCELEEERFESDLLQTDQYGQWFTLWNHQLRQMCSYIQWVEYFNSTFRNMRSFQ